MQVSKEITPQVFDNLVFNPTCYDVDVDEARVRSGVGSALE